MMSSVAAKGQGPDPGEQEPAIAPNLAAVVGGGQILPFDTLGKTDQQRVRSVLALDALPNTIMPSTQNELAEVVAWAHHHRARLLIRGRGTKLSWGGLTQKIDGVLSTQRLDRILDHDPKDLTVTVEAGVPFAKLQARLAQKQQFVALEPAYPEDATVGGIIASQDAGAWRHRYGGVRDMVLGIHFVRADGERVKAGGRVVKNVAGYDLMKLLTGSFGTLGVIAQVTLRLYPLPEASTTRVLTGMAAAIAQATQTLLRGTLTPTAVDIVSPQLLADAQLTGEFGLAVRLQGLPASVTAQGDRLSNLARDLNLAETRFTEAEDAQFWAQLQQALWQPQTSAQTAVVCKIGVLPATAISTLTTMVQQQPEQVCLRGRVHAGSGLGVLRLEGAVTPALILGLRSLSQQNQGFLTVLEAPRDLKQQLDIWGYSGNALQSMRRLKKQFDAHNLLNPGRFVGGI